MAKRNIKRGAAAVMLMVVIGSAASCGGRAASNEMQDHLLSGVSVGGADVEEASSAEARHFDAYQQYRLLSD